MKTTIIVGLKNDNTDRLAYFVEGYEVNFTALATIGTKTVSAINAKGSQGYDREHTEFEIELDGMTHCVSDSNYSPYIVEKYVEGWEESK